MNKEYTSLGLMSGTSGDGVDASIWKLVIFILVFNHHKKRAIVAYRPLINLITQSN